MTILPASLPVERTSSDNGIAVYGQATGVLVQGNRVADPGSTMAAAILTGGSTTTFIDGNFCDSGANGVFDFSGTPVLGQNRPAFYGDVRALGGVQGAQAIHDGTNANTVGPAFYDGTGRVSTVNGSSIA